jgi:membrane protease YdiL (CAAX protease family)
VVVVAPLGEELLFRGFLYRGWASSWLGVGGTILVTSLLWAMLHQQYNWYGILVIFCLGLLFGWLRQRSGTTTLTMILHALNNLFTMILVAAKLEWAS